MAVFGNIMRDATRVTIGRGLRAFADGFASLLLPLHLNRLGFSPFEIGAISTLALTGSALLSLVTGFQTHRASVRHLSLFAALLMAASGAAFGMAQGFWPLALIAFMGTLNVSGGDASLFVPLEHATIANGTPGSARTLAFANYGFLGPLLAGAWLAATPFGWPLIAAGVIKIGYDLALLAMFARVKPLEEKD